MTREEQIKAEAKKYYSEDIKCYDAFLHGVEFAERLSTWISVEEDLPCNHKELLYDSSFTYPVLVITKKKGFNIDIAEMELYYRKSDLNAEVWKWSFDDESCEDEVTHWMPIPGLNE